MALPAESEREPGPDAAAAERAGAAARRLVVALVNNAAHDVLLTRVADALEGLATELEPSARTSRYDGHAPFQPGSFAADLVRSHPYLGRANPVAPPLDFVRTADGVHATATYDRRWEGPPGAVHGGALAGAFDLMLAAAASAAEKLTMTGTLTVKYLRPTPLGVPVTYEAGLLEVRDRAVRTWGLATAEGQVTAEGEGVFVVVDREHFDSRR
ncbi:MAG TPA: hotdog domain-containing protein [Acidimicrobiia bacterium]|jgi:acyl-coenzyme A thioesterase PaaI-like protein